MPEAPPCLGELERGQGVPTSYYPTVELLPPGEIKAIRGAGPHWRLLGESNPEPYQSAPGPLLGPLQFLFVLPLVGVFPSG